jgi:replicative DNA helicase
LEDIQKVLLSIILIYPQERHLIFKGLSEKHFSGQYRTVFKECVKLYQSNKEIDPVVIVADLGNEYMNLIVMLSDVSLINKPNTDEYISLLKNAYNKRQAMTKTKELILKIEKDELNNNQEIQDAYLEICKLFNEEEKVRKINITQGFSELLDDLESKTEYIKTWFKKLDKYVLIDRGDYIIIGGRPSSGKTTIAINMMMNMAAEYNVDFFSLETNALKVFRKIAASTAKISINKIQNKNMLDDDYKNLLTTANSVTGYKLNVIEAAGMSVQDITSIALQDKADIIVIDYLQLLSAQGKSLYEQTSNISKDLHIFAQKEKVTVIALAQLKRTDRKEPTMSDLRESGQIEQDADVILLMHNPAEIENEDLNKQFRDCIIAKNKTGMTGKIKFDFHGVTQTFQEAYQ